MCFRERKPKVVRSADEYAKLMLALQRAEYISPERRDVLVDEAMQSAGGIKKLGEESRKNLPPGLD